MFRLLKCFDQYGRFKIWLIFSIGEAIIIKTLERLIRRDTFKGGGREMKI